MIRSCVAIDRLIYNIRSRMTRLREIENIRPDGTGELFGRELSLNSQLVWEAYELAKQVHGEQKRNTGEPYFESHCVPVATALQTLLPVSKWTDEIVAGALLHDVVEDHGDEIGIEDIRVKFGDRVALLVDGVTKMGTPDGGWGHRWEKDRSALQKMARHAYEDVGVALIKLTDRSHNMKTFGTSSEKTRRIKSGEAIRAYGKLAGILGCYEWKRWLEDMAFPYYEPEIYQKIKRLVDNDPRLDRLFIKRMSQDIGEYLAEVGIEARIEIVCAGYYETWKKVEQKARSRRGASDDLKSVGDLVSFRVVLSGDNDLENIYKCYSALGMLHYRYADYLVDDKIDDFVAVPQDSYMALQTSLDIPDVGEIEIAVETEEMYGRNQWGVVYDAESGKSLDGYKVVTVITPSNGLRFVPEGASVLDAVVSIQPNLIREISGVLRNGRPVDIDDVVGPGDLLEVQVNGERLIMDDSWLQVSHDIHSRRVVKQLLLEQQSRGLLEMGENEVRMGLREMGLISINDLFVLRQKEMNQILYEFGLSGVDDLYMAIGARSVSWQEVSSLIIEKELIPDEWLSVEIKGGGEANVPGVMNRISEYVSSKGGNFLRIVHDTDEDRSFVLRMLIEGYDKQEKESLRGYCQSLSNSLSVEVVG
jgi:GTP diphosphokinase / guanosine-3',5'-bis(diphosphate) 3'-diphosphatase